MSVMTSMQIVGTNSTGNMTTQAYVLESQGGMGFSYTPTTLDTAKVLQVNALGTALTLDITPPPGALQVYSFYRFS